MNRLILVRHGGSTGNEDGSFYAYNDSAVCLTTNGIRQALNTAGVIAQIEPRWAKPGNFALEVYASEYTRTQQTARITLDQMGLLSVQPEIRPLLNERDYGSHYAKVMDEDPYCSLDGSESGARARVRVRGFLAETIPVLDRADVLAFTHMGATRALIAELLELSDAEMMTRPIDNGAAFLFERLIDPQGRSTFEERPLPAHVLPKLAAPIVQPPAAPPPNP
ncbi:MAG TPA: histidine phosphatase family protein [Caulobacteraceae bacterium]|nr:histidine phosphatase family protein [Caulobacteraceae bacterium]